MSDSINGDDEKLYDLILKNLQSTGILHNYKIQLTEEILKILNNETTEEPQKYEQMKSCLNYDENILCLHLIKDTLDYLGLSYTSLMLEKEIGGLSNLYNNKSKNDIEKQIDKLKFIISKNNSTNSHNYHHDHHNNNLSNSENNQNNDTITVDSHHHHNYSNSVTATSSSSQTYSSQFSTQNDDHKDSLLLNINKPILLKILDNVIKNELPSSTTNRDNSSPHDQNTISNETFIKSPSE